MAQSRVLLTTVTVVSLAKNRRQAQLKTERHNKRSSGKQKLVHVERVQRLKVHGSPLGVVLHLLLRALTHVYITSSHLSH